MFSKRLYAYTFQTRFTLILMNNFPLVLRAANLLSNEADVKPGDRVMVILPAIPEYWLIQAACLRTGTE